MTQAFPILRAPREFAGHDPNWYLPQALDEGAEPRMTLGELRAMAWRQRRLVAILAAFAAAFGVFLTFLLTPMYTAIATVSIDNQQIQVVQGQDVTPMVATYDMDRYLNTQKRVLESRRMAFDVIDALALAQDDRALRALGIEPGGDMTELRDAMAEALIAGLAVEIPPQTRLAEIEFVSRDPALSSRIANGYAEEFVRYNISSTSEANRYAREILEDQVEQAQAELRTAEEEAVAYARENRIIDLAPVVSEDGTGQSASIKVGSLEQLNEAYILARTERIKAQGRYEAASGSNPMDLAEARDNVTLQTLIGQRATAIAELRELQSRYLPEAPEVRKAQARVDALDEQISMASRRLRGSLQNEYQIARQQEERLLDAMMNTADETLAEQDRRIQLNLLTREMGTKRLSLQQLQERLDQVNSASDVVANNVSVIDLSKVPSGPSSPNLPRNLLFSLLVGLAIGGMLAVLREALDDTINLPEDAERKLDINLLGTTPLMAGDESEELDSMSSEISEAYFSIRFALDFATGGDQKKIIQITSTKPSEGKTTTALALARDFARIGRKVILVDGDLRKPSIGRLIGVRSEAGLGAVLTHSARLADAITRLENPRFDVLTLGRIPERPAQLLSSRELTDLFADLRTKYDVVIIDSSPVMGLADAPLVARAADYTVLVVEGGRVHNGQARAALRRLRIGGAKMAGVVLSKYDRRGAGYGYGYGYYSEYRYGDDPSARAA